MRPSAGRVRAARRARGPCAVKVVGQDSVDETYERLMRAAAQPIESSGGLLWETEMRVDSAVHGSPF